MPQLSTRFQSLPEYPLASMPQKKRALIARGVDVIDLGAGDADLAPPPAAVDALDEAARTPALNRYGFGLGNPAFREAVAAWMRRRFGVSFDPFREVVPLIGSKEGISHLALGYLDRGDVAIIPQPGYNAYLGGALLSEATPYPYALRPRTSFLIDLDEIPSDVLARTKLLYLNYPNNPTAAVAPRDYLERIVRRCRELDVLLVYDNAYSELAFDGYVPPSIFEIDGARDVAIEFHSLSKTYNMTGWRCGWAVARPEVAGTLAKVKSFIDTGAFMAVQQAGVAAIESWAEFVPANVAVFRERRDAAVAAFRAAGFRCETPLATMYLWLPLPEGVSSAHFADRLLEEEGVIVLPGSGFGAGGEGFFRISFITSPERIREAAVRAGRVLASMTGAAGGGGSPSDPAAVGAGAPALAGRQDAV
jgi:LL-diaminopimelate aminotransferase